MKVYLLKQCNVTIRVFSNSVKLCGFLKNWIFTNTGRRRRNVRIKDFEVEEWRVGSRGCRERSFRVRTLPHFAEIELCEKLP